MIQVLILTAALSANADKPYSAQPLAGAPLSALATWASARWADITPSKVISLWCKRHTQIDPETGEGTLGAQCAAVTKQTLSAANVLAAAEAKRLLDLPDPDDIAADGSTAEVRVSWPIVFVTGADLAGFTAISTTVLGLPAAALRMVEVTKHVDDEGVVSYTMSGMERVAKTAAEWMLCVKDGTCTALVE